MGAIEKISENVPAERQSHVAQALQAIANGQSAQEVARSTGIPPSTLYRDILLSTQDEAEAARASFCTLQMVDRLEAMESAEGPLELARARESLRGWQWLAERRAPRWYAPQQQTGPQGGIAIQINVGNSAGKPAPTVTQAPDSEG